MGRVRSPKRRVRDDDFILGYRRIIVELWSKRLSIGGSTSGSFCWNLELQIFVAGAVFGEVGGWLYLLHAMEMTFHMWCGSRMRCILRGRRSIWWGLRVTLLAPRIGNDVSYVTQIIDDIHCMAGAVFGEVGRWLFVAGAALRDILGDSRTAKCCILQHKIVSKMGRVRSPKRRVRDDDFIVGLSSDIVESSFYWRKHFREFPLKSWASRFRGRRSIWWGWRVTLLAPRIGNDVSYVTQIIDDIHFAWQAQYLVRLEGDFTCSTHWKWRFICDADHWWHRFCVAGAVFGEVGGWLFVAGAALRDILGDSWTAKCCILQHKIVSKMGGVRSPKRRVRDDDFILGYRRIIVGYRRIVFLLAEALQGVSAEILSFKISWQAQYLVRLEGDFTCSTHWKWRFICDADHWWHSFCGQAQYIWWSWRVTLVAPLIVNDVSK